MCFYLFRCGVKYSFFSIGELFLSLSEESQTPCRVVSEDGEFVVPKVGEIEENEAKGLIAEKIILEH